MKGEIRKALGTGTNKEELCWNICQCRMEQQLGIQVPVSRYTRYAVEFLQFVIGIGGLFLHHTTAI